MSTNKGRASLLRKNQSRAKGTVRKKQTWRVLRSVAAVVSRGVIRRFCMNIAFARTGVQALQGSKAVLPWSVKVLQWPRIL